MILILCDTMDDVEAAYHCFLEFLYENDPWHVRQMFDSAYIVETDDDLKYAFVDRRYINYYAHVRPDVVDVSEFFEGVDTWYNN